MYIHSGYLCVAKIETTVVKTKILKEFARHRHSCTAFYVHILHFEGTFEFEAARMTRLFIFTSSFVLHSTEMCPLNFNLIKELVTEKYKMTVKMKILPQNWYFR